jgi:CheY-like chemotaxis protein
MIQTTVDDENVAFKGTILIVDDEAVARMSLAEVLKLEGYQVATAASGEEALRLVDQSELFDLIVLDYRMPGMDGLEVTASLRRNRRTQYIPIMIVTAFGSLEAAVRALRLGVNDFILKPVELNELLARVERLVYPRLVRSGSEFDTGAALPGRQDVEERLAELVFDQGWTVYLLQVRNPVYVKQVADFLAHAEARFVGRWGELEFVVILGQEEAEREYTRLKGTGLPLSVGMVRGQAVGSFADAEGIVAMARKHMTHLG